MTSVLLTTRQGEKMPVNALKYEFAESVASGSMQRRRPGLVGAFLNALMCGGDYTFVPDGGHFTRIRMDNGWALEVQETPEQVHEAMQAAMKGVEIKVQVVSPKP